MRAGSRRRFGVALAGAAFLLAVGGLAYTGIAHARVRASGRADLGSDWTEMLVFGSAMVSAAAVGLIVAVRQSRHPVGWLFLALALALSVGGAGDAFALEHVVVRGERGAGAALALVAGQASFIAWFGLLAAILHLTPTGRPLGPRWARAMAVTAVAATVGLSAKAVQDARFDPPYGGIRNPWALTAIGSLVDVVAALAIVVTMLGLIVAGGSLAVRFRRAAGDERRQLRWLAVLIVPLPVLAVVAYVAAVAGAPVLRTVATGGFVALVPITAGLSVQRYRLYDVDHILSRAASYTLSCVGLAVIFGGVAAALGRTLGAFVDDAVVPAVLATVVAVSAAVPLHRRLQDIVDRRFDRRRYDAHRLVRDHVRGSTSGRGLEATLATALHDPTLTIAYWMAAQRRWVSAEGDTGTLEAGDIEVSRNGAPVARLRVDSARVDTRLALSLATTVLAELDNVRLRSEVAMQLVEVRESRARIVAAEAAERHRIERNLHDGAQQRLLGLAMQLRAVRLRTDDAGAPDRYHLDHAVDEIGAALRELRDLANGLHPSVLADGGLRAALDDLAGRTPLSVHLDVPPTRLPPAVEETLWFVACEAVANTIKHADARRVRIELTVDRGTARLVCADDGLGGAHLRGSGLRGIADRTEGIGGSLRLDSSAGRGTTIVAVVPCG